MFICIDKIGISFSLKSLVSSEFPPGPELPGPADRLVGRPVVAVTARSRGGVASVGGRGDDADVQEVVGVAEVFAEPLQRSLQQRLDAVDHHLVALRLTWMGTEDSSFHNNNNNINNFIYR